MSSNRQRVPQTDLVVRLVVRGRDLEHAGAELEVDGFVTDDRQARLIFDWQRTADASCR